MMEHDVDAPVFAISVAAQLSGLHPQTLRQYDAWAWSAPAAPAAAAACTPCATSPGCARSYTSPKPA